MTVPRTRILAMAAAVTTATVGVVALALMAPAPAAESAPPNPSALLACGPGVRQVSMTVTRAAGERETRTPDQIMTSVIAAEGTAFPKVVAAKDRRLSYKSATRQDFTLSHRGAVVAVFSFTDEGDGFGLESYHHCNA